MQHTPERATALACLLRAIVAMLAAAPFNAPLVEWGRELHERFALPYYLENDLNEVLHALDEAGLGLDAPLQAELRRDEFRRWGTVELPGCRLEVRRALEFWPLLGDAASPEQGGASRLMDASTARVELRMRPTDADGPGWRDWQLTTAGVELPMRPERDAPGRCTDLRPALPAPSCRAGACTRRWSRRHRCACGCAIPRKPPTPASRCTNGGPTARPTPGCPKTWPRLQLAVPSESASRRRRASPAGRRAARQAWAWAPTASDLSCLS